MSKPEVVITGLGIVSPYGCDIHEYYDRLAACEIALKPTPWMPPEAGSWFSEVPDFNPEDWMSAQVAEGSRLTEELHEDPYRPLEVEARALGVPVVDPQLAPPGRGAPVDVTPAVTRVEQPDVGELEATTLGRRDPRPRRDAGPRRPGQRVQRLDLWQHPEHQLECHGALVRDQPERGRQPHPDPRPAVDAPLRRRDPEPDRRGATR